MLPVPFNPHRIRRQASGRCSASHFKHARLNRHPLAEYDSAGNAIREYVWLDGMPVAMFTPDPAAGANAASSAPLVYYIHADHLNTPRVLVDKNNAMRWRWLGEPFGTTAPETSPQGLPSLTFNLRHPGQFYDVESGMFYNLNRDYVPGAGRYTQSDPIGLPPESE